jgi:hypothetical protein
MNSTQTNFRRSRLVSGILLVLCLSILLGSCGPSGLSPAQIKQATDSAAALTVQAVSTALAGKWTATPSPPTATRPTPTRTATATRTPVPPTKTRTPSPTIATDWAKCLQAEFISETVPDGAVIAPETFFTQSWTLKNTGTCYWTKDFKMVFESGEPMTNITEIQFLTKDLAPGKQVTINVKMVAPLETGEKLGFWKLQNKEGIRFGLGEEGGPVWTRIVVAEDTNEEFKVISAQAFAVPNNFRGACGKNGYTITLYGKIKTNKAGIVRYTWVGSEGVARKPKELTFFGAYEMEVFDTVTYTKGVHYSYARLKIIEPNPQTFEKTSFNVECIY